MNPKDVNYNVIIFILMLVTGCIIYFMYFQSIEKFVDPSSTPAYTWPSSTPAYTWPSSTPANTQPSSTPANTLPSTTPFSTIPSTTPSITKSSSTTTAPVCVPAPTLPTTSVLSRFFGVGFNINKVKYNDADAYIINHIPTVSNGTLGGCYAISQDSLLTIKLKNSLDNTQLFTITQNKFTDSVGMYFTIIPVSNKSFALQYESGNLALRPYNPDNIYESQKWIMSGNKITRGIPVLNYSPGSLFTAEFDPYSTPSTNTNNITDSNVQQINDVVSAVKSGIQKYLGQLDNKQQLEQVSASSLGQKDQPLNINFSINSDSETKGNKLSTLKQKSRFENVSNQSTSLDMINIMDKYGPSSSGKSNNDNLQLYKKSDLENEVSKSQGCKMLNINDYTSNRVGSCNCKL